MKQQGALYIFPCLFILWSVHSYFLDLLMHLWYLFIDLGSSAAIEQIDFLMSNSEFYKQTIDY